MLSQDIDLTSFRIFREGHHKSYGISSFNFLVSSMLFFHDEYTNMYHF